MGKNSRKNRKNKKKAEMKEALENSLIEGGNPMTQDQAVFVYGTLMSSGANHMFIGGEDSTFMGSAYTTEAKWGMVSFFKFPGVIAGKKNHIWGELYICSRLVLEQLDVLEANGTLFQREKVQVTLTDDDTHWDAWMYVVMPTRLSAQDDPDRYTQPGVSQYAFSDDNETPVDHWEPATANLTEAAPQTVEAPTADEVEVEIEIDPRMPRRFTKQFDRDKGKVYYVAEDDGEVVQTLTLDAPKKKSGSSTSTSTSSTTSSSSSSSTATSHGRPVLTAGKDPEKVTGQAGNPDGSGFLMNERPIGQRPPLVIGQGGVPETSADTLKLHEDASKRWSAAVAAAVKDAAGESTLADSTADEDQKIDLAEKSVDDNVSMYDDQVYWS